MPFEIPTTLGTRRNLAAAKVSPVEVETGETVSLIFGEDAVRGHPSITPAASTDSAVQRRSPRLVSPLSPTLSPMP
ncbi:hypothetical protein OG792_34350 [Micromonospora sp. NBC_01699]|uniref:hypothetical protein n=1 Tax=Micromonospora sp. NBC_01699 TaxID=2975984 RepID=UPI002E378A3F|nr:hypothetical protein [Micromonospora sp. NBC_01699]